MRRGFKFWRFGFSCFMLAPAGLLLAFVPVPAIHNLGLAVGLSLGGVCCVCLAISTAIDEPL